MGRDYAHTSDVLYPRITLSNVSVHKRTIKAQLGLRPDLVTIWATKAQCRLAEQLYKANKDITIRIRWQRKRLGGKWGTPRLLSIEETRRTADD
jgi:threonine aldolase